MCFQVMDARDMAEFEAESFDAVIDKGMTDSIMYNDKFALMMAKVTYPIPSHPIPTYHVAKRSQLQGLVLYLVVAGTEIATRF